MDRPRECIAEGRPMLIRVLYISSVAPGLTGSDIDRLVASSRRRNRQLDLTGALVVCAVRFAQVLEGRDEAVDAMTRRIAADPRHTNMQLVDRAAVGRRLCDGWDMAFVDDASWASILDGVSAGVVTPDQFYGMLLERVEQMPSSSLSFQRLQGGGPDRRS